MEWTPKCPKCSSANISIERSGAFFGPREDDIVFKCYVCGNRIYGRAAIEETFEAQKRAFMKDPDIRAEAKRKAEEARRKAEEEQTMRKRMAVANKHAREKAEADRLAEEQEQERKRQEWLARVKASQEASHKTQKSAQATTGTVSKAEVKKMFGECFWFDCHEPARARSKYCSRGCTVKYAHYRDKVRKGRIEPRPEDPNKSPM